MDALHPAGLRIALLYPGVWFALYQITGVSGEVSRIFFLLMLVADAFIYGALFRFIRSKVLAATSIVYVACFLFGVLVALSITGDSLNSELYWLVQVMTISAMLMIKTNSPGLNRLLIGSVACLVLHAFFKLDFFWELSSLEGVAARFSPSRHTGAVLFQFLFYVLRAIALFPRAGLAYGRPG